MSNPEDENKATPENEADTENNTNSEDTASYASAAEALGLNLESEGLFPHPDSVEDLHKEMNELEKKVDEYKDKTMRAMAELENTRRIAKRDITNAHKFALEKFVNDLLPVLDSLEQGLEASNADNETAKAIHDGLELTQKMFIDTLAKYSVESINPVGETFNPEFHEAMSMQETADAKPNSVLAVIQKGYILNGRVIRAARVVVAKAAK